MGQWWHGFFSRELARVRRDGRAAVLWSLRVTVAATASYVVASWSFPGTQPLLAPLTAMLVVQVTPLSLLASGLDRVVSVVAGVGLAVGFAAVVPLEWWSLGVLILISITMGQFLRLRANLVEVAISAMLVLGVGAIGAGAAAWQRIAETLVGAAVGIVATLVFPPKVASSDAGRAIDALADAMTELLLRAADELESMAEGERQRLPGSAREWLDDARRITHDIPVAGAALLRAEEGRRLNVRAVRTPRVEPGLRQGLEALEHTAVSIRVLMRFVADASDGDWLEDEAATEVLRDLAQTFRELAAGTDAFGALVRHEGDVQVGLSAADVLRLQDAHNGLVRARQRLDAALATDRPADVAELYAATRATVRRVQHELGLEERVRRQFRLTPERRAPLPLPRAISRPTSRRRPDVDSPPSAGPDDETQVLPPVGDDPEERA
jgi:hypothetical protein